MEENSITPLVSVIMPLYNAQNYVAEAIESILKQSYTNWELIVVNDGSTDNSLSIVKKYEGDKIFVYNQPNSGQCAANNFGFSKSKGQYIKFFDADDILSEDFLKAQVEALQGTENYIASASWGRFYNNHLSTFKLSNEDCWKDMPPIDWLHSSWRNAQPMMQCALWLIPKSILQKSGLWNEKLSLINDFDFFTRVILASSKVKFCKQSILYYRSGITGSLSDQKSKKAIDSAFTSISLATGQLLSKDNSALSKLCCANIWQNFVYEFYFMHPTYAQLAATKIRALDGSDLRISSGGITKILNILLGWKLTLLIKTKLKQIKNDNRKKSSFKKDLY